MDAGGGTGSIPFAFLPLSKRQKKNQNLGTVHRNTTLRRKKKTVHPALPQKKKREKHKKYEHIEHGRGM